MGDAPIPSQDGILRLEVVVNGLDPDEGVFKILAEIKPSWKREDVYKKPLGEEEGYLNVLYKYVNTRFDDAIVIRVFGDGFGEYMDRLEEVKAYRLLGELNIAPELYCLFKNGMCTSFVSGKTFNIANLEGQDLHLAKLCAKELAKFHSKKAVRLAHEKYGIEKINRIEASINNWFEDWGPSMKDLHPLVSSPEFPTKDEVFAEVKKMREVLCDLDMPFVFCHNDIHPGNVIYDEERGFVTVIDYEFSSFNYSGFDLAWYLFYSAFGMGVDPSDESPPMHPKEFQLEFCRAYLQSLSYEDSWSRDVTDDDVMNLREKVLKYLLYIMLINIPIELLMAQKPPQKCTEVPQYYRGSLKSWKLYLSLKDEYMKS